jgi:3',5'-cyclic AMP phosphodiesterase CpdA
VKGSRLTHALPSPVVRALRLLTAVALVVAGACRAPTRAADTAPFFFIQMSDPQFGFFTANQDFVRETSNFERAIAAANRLHPAFVVVTGDLTHKMGDQAQIAEYRRIVGKLDRSIPLYSVPGNHDLALPLTEEGVAAYRKMFGADRYTFRSGAVLGIVLNSSLVKEPAATPRETAEQEQWLRATLRTARSRGYARIFIFQHHSWFLVRPDEPDQYYNLPLATRRMYLDLFRESGVGHVFAGHYHRNAFARDGDLEMVTTGPVGKPLGQDSSGFRIVSVDGRRVSHRYYPLDSIPAAVTAAAVP